MRTSVSVLAILLMVLMAVPRLGAQSHAAPQSALDAAVQQHVAATSADREAAEAVQRRRLHRTRPLRRQHARPTDPKGTL